MKLNRNLIKIEEETNGFLKLSLLSKFVTIRDSQDINYLAVNKEVF